MRLGLIGLGRIGAFHAETLASSPVVESLVITDVVPATVQAVADRLAAGGRSVHAVESVAAVFGADVDGIVVAASTDTHPQLIRAAVDAGLPVFCEKPLARVMADGLALAAALEGSDVPVQIGYPRRFDAGFTAARAAVRSGELGWLHTVRATTLDPAPPPAAYIAGSGGIFRDCSVHDFDAIRWVTGREVVEVFATGSNRGEDFIRAAGDVDTSAAVLTLDDGTLAVVSNSRYNAGGHDVRLEVHGSLDSVGAGLDDGLPLRSVEPGARVSDRPAHHFFMDRFADAFRSELAAFTDVVAGTRPSPCTVADALAAGWIAEACTLSLLEGRSVRLDELTAPAPTMDGAATIIG